MTPETFEALKPFGVAGLALAVLYFTLSSIGFDPIKLTRKHGIVAFVVFVVVVGGVVALAIVMFAPRSSEERRDPYVQAGSKLSVLFAMISDDPEKSVNLTAASASVMGFVLERGFSAKDDRALVEQICAAYPCLECKTTTSSGLDHITISLITEMTSFEGGVYSCN